MNAHTSRNLLIATLPLVLATFANHASAQLVDPGFENNPLETARNVLNNFVPGVWGAEMATITTGPVGLVTPPEGIRMLRMTDAGLISTQVFQVTDVNAHAPLIDSGNARVTLNALFNADPGVTAANGAVVVQFFVTPNWHSSSTRFARNRVLDTDPETWQRISINNGVVPVGTRWIVSQLYFSNASLGGLAGFTDAAVLRITDARIPWWLDVSGVCPGQINVAWSGAQPNVSLALIYAGNTGSFVIPHGPCQGTVLGLGSAGIQLVGVFNSGSGSGSINGSVGPASCGGFIQMHDLPACTLSNVAQIP